MKQRAGRLFFGWVVAFVLAMGCMAAVGASPGALQGTPETAASHHAAGVAHVKAGRVNEALAEFRQALRRDRNHLPSLLQMADLLSSNSRIFAAYGVLRHAARVAPASAQVHALLGRCFFLMKRFKEGRQALHRALELDSDLSEPHFALAVIESEQGRLAEARRHIETYLERASGTEVAQAQEVRARISLKRKDYDAALAAYTALGQADPARATLQMEIARTLLVAGRYAEAEQAYQAVLEKNPADREALRGWFDSSHKRGAYQQALEAMQLLAKLEPESCEPLLNRARAYRLLNQFPQARQQTGRCLELQPENSFAHFMQGRIWFGQGNLARAKTALMVSVQVAPNYVDALYWLATVELRLGEKASALRRLEKAVSLDPEHAGVRYSLALQYTRQDRRAEAEQHLAEFRRIKNRKKWKLRSSEDGASAMGGPGPGGPVNVVRLSNWLNFAKYLVQEDKPRDALLILKEAQQVAPEDPEVLRITAVAHAEVGEIDQALAAYAAAEQHGPTALVFFGRGQIYFRLEENELAFADLSRAVSLELPADKAAETHLLLASLLNKQKRYGDAEAELRRALALNPDHAATRGLLGWTLLQRGKAAEAAAEGRRVLKENSRNASAGLILAQALIQRKQLSAASAQLRRVAALQGESGLVLLVRGKLALAQGMRKVAIDYFARAGQVDPSQVEAFYLLGVQLQEDARSSEAAVAFEKATILDPAHARSWLALGKLYLNSKSSQRAVGYFRQAVAAAPKNAEAHYQLAVALAQSGQRPEAERAARQAKALGHAAAPALLQSLTGAPPR